ncbi:hypothetical protein CR513_15676, partial [Mucuna pruriens]
MTVPSHQYHTRSRARHMEQAIDDLEQQNMEMRAEMGQMREQINKMFELLTQNTALLVVATAPTLGAISNAVTQGTPTYPPGFTPQYGMPLGWNTTTDGQVVEGQEQPGASHPTPQPMQATVSLPQPTYLIGAQMGHTE